MFICTVELGGALVRLWPQVHRVNMNKAANRNNQVLCDSLETS